MAILFDLKDISVQYGSVSALHNFSYQFLSGSITTIIGENGSGKSTLLNCLAGLVPTHSGAICFEGQMLSNFSPLEIAQSISSLGQSDVKISDMPVWMRVSQGFYPHEGASFVPNAEQQNAIEAIAEELAFHHCLHRQLGQLSGGERRRVNLARALVDPRPKAIVLDEPFANIDIGHQPLVIDALHKRHQTGQTIICAVQQLHLVPELNGTVLGMRGGQMEASGAASDILTDAQLEKLFNRKGRLVQTTEGFSGVLFETPKQRGKNPN
tara:strand:- start:942 stop:1745 length:804 start_codon:yes stop_codon:yes gene_type:complete